MIPDDQFLPSPLGYIAYADCFSGISGDMFLGALLHNGLSQETLLAELARLDIGSFELTTEATTCSSIAACKVSIRSPEQQPHRHLSSIIDLLTRSDLSRKTVKTAIAVFKELARAEALVHGCSMEDIHFHEVGAIDSIVDIVGTVIGLEQLGIIQLTSSPLPMGKGVIHCQHGTLPSPAPATAEILTGVPIYGVNIDQELVTPTGAALLKVLTTEFGPMPPMTIHRTGYGAGSHILPENRPNLFRLIIGTPTHQLNEAQEVEVLETNLDDWNPEGFPHLCSLLIEQQALDVSLVPIQMKKGRPGFLLRVICQPAHGMQLKQTILAETTAIGLRFRKEQRLTLERHQVTVATSFGDIEAKQITTASGPVIYPEYEACRQVAIKYGVPLQQVYREILTAKPMEQ